MALRHAEDVPVFGRYEARHWPALLDMYLTFEPKAAYQGLPPFKEAVTRRWLASLVENERNTNFVLLIDGRIAAHAALVYYPHTPDEQEIIIFVHQDFQHRGWGRELFLAAMWWGCLRLRLRDVWLSVTWDNAPAWRMYRAIGFRPVSHDPMDPDIIMARPFACPDCSRDTCPTYNSRLIHEYEAAFGPEREPARESVRPNASKARADLARDSGTGD